LGNNIAVNEMNFYLNPPSIATVRRRSQIAYFAFDNSLPTLLLWTSQLWPRYQTDQHYENFANTTIPLLLMNGEIDPATDMEMARFMVSGLRIRGKPNQYFISIPNAAHGLIFDGEYKECAFKMGINFYKTNQLDSSCLRTLNPLDFRGNTRQIQEISREVFGIADMWTGI